MKASMLGYRPISSQRGFTIVEMLVVVTIMVIMGAVVMPSLSGLLSGSQVRSASATLVNIFQLADASAQAKRRYVYVGLCQIDSGTVLVGMADAADGITTQDEGAALVAAARPQILTGVTLTSPDQILSAVSLPAAATTGVDSFLSSQFNLSVSYKGNQVNCPYTIQFAPDGSVSLQKKTASRYIQLGLSPARRTNSRDVSLVQVAGLTGGVTSWLPQ